MLLPSARDFAPEVNLYLPRESRILVLYYFEGMTLEEVGQQFPGRKKGTHLTRERVNQIRGKALGKIRERINPELIEK